MEYSEIVQSVAESVLEALKVDGHSYQIDSLKDEKEKAEFARRLKEQNDKIDKETPEQRANRRAQFYKSINNTAKKEVEA